MQRNYSYSEGIGEVQGVDCSGYFWYAIPSACSTLISAATIADKTPHTLTEDSISPRTCETRLFSFQPQSSLVMGVRSASKQAWLGVQKCAEG